MDNEGSPARASWHPRRATLALRTRDARRAAVYKRSTQTGLFLALLAATPAFRSPSPKASREAQIETTDSDRKPVKSTFFQISYLTWFLIPLCVPMLGVLVIVALALDHVIDKASVAEVLSGLFWVRARKRFEPSPERAG